MERIVVILSFVLPRFKCECGVTTTAEWGTDNLAKCNSSIVSLSKGGGRSIQLLENYTNPTSGHGLAALAMNVVLTSFFFHLKPLVIFWCLLAAGCRHIIISLPR